MTSIATTAYREPIELADVADQVGWYDGRLVTIETGVRTLTDRLSLCNLSQATTTKQPAWDATAGDGGREIITFDGSSDVLSTTACGLGANSFEAWLLLRNLNWGANQFLFTLTDGGGGYFQCSAETTPRWRWRHNDGANVENYNTNAVSDNDTHLARFYIDTARQKLGSQLDSGTPSEANDATGVVAKPNLYLANNSAAAYGNIALLDFAVVNRILSLAERCGRVARINHRFGLSFPLPTV